MTGIPLNRFEWLKSATRAELPDSAKVVASVLAIQFADQETGKICPSLSTLCDYLGCSLSKLKRALKALVEAGWLHRTEGRGRGNLTRYTLTSPGKIVAFKAPKKSPKPVQEKGFKSEPSAPKSTEEKGSDMIEKGFKSAPSYIEQSLEQYGGTLPKAPKDRPARHLRKLVQRGSDLEAEWSRWLSENRLPGLCHFAPLRDMGEDMAWDLPWSYPPGSDDTQTRILKSFIAWGIERNRHIAGRGAICA